MLPAHHKHAVESSPVGNRLLDPARLFRLFDYIWILDRFVFRIVLTIFSQKPKFEHSAIFTVSKWVLSAAVISGESCNTVQAEFPTIYLWAYPQLSQFWCAFGTIASRHTTILNRFRVPDSSSAFFLRLSDSLGRIFPRFEQNPNRLSHAQQISNESEKTESTWVPIFGSNTRI